MICLCHTNVTVILASTIDLSRLPYMCSPTNGSGGGGGGLGLPRGRELFACAWVCCEVFVVGHCGREAGMLSYESNHTREA